VPFDMSEARRFEIAIKLARELHQGLAQDLATAKAREAEKQGSSFRPRNALLRVKLAGNLLTWIEDMETKQPKLAGSQPQPEGESDAN
jgi:hypothetical protein